MYDDYDEFGRLEANARYDMTHDDVDELDPITDGYDDYGYDYGYDDDYDPSEDDIDQYDGSEW